MSCSRLPGVTLRQATTEDVDAVAQLNAAVHGEGVGGFTRRLAAGPVCQPSDFWLAQSRCGAVVSTLCLIPGQLRVGPATVPYGEVGIVGTHEDWRGRGLCSDLMQEAHADLVRRGLGLGLLAGIPYFYRRFGYEYTVPLDTHHNLSLDAVPPAAGWSLRRATLGDAPAIEDWYAAAGALLDVSGALRSRALLESLLPGQPGSDTDSEFYLLLQGQVAVGYLRIALCGFGPGLIICEAWAPERVERQAMLGLCADLARQRGKPYLRLDLPTSHPLVAASTKLGGKLESVYAWQAVVVDPLLVLSALRPALEARISGSWVLHLHTYRETIELASHCGQLVHVGPPERAATASASVPREQLAALLLGSRGFEELAATRPDLRADAAACDLLAALFPRLDGWVVPQY